MIRYTLVVSLVSGLFLPNFVLADVGHGNDDADHDPITVELVVPEMNASVGRELFAEKGCVACHSVNGVGGEDSVPLDAHNMDPVMNPFEFAAKMWTMAPYMIEAQEEAFGEQLLFTGDELANIIAFLHDDGEQHMLTEASLSDEVLEMLDHGHEGEPGEEAHEEELGHD